MATLGQASVTTCATSRFAIRAVDRDDDRTEPQRGDVRDDEIAPNWAPTAARDLRARARHRADALAARRDTVIEVRRSQPAVGGRVEDRARRFCCPHLRPRRDERSLGEEVVGHAAQFTCRSRPSQ